jgi:hypothetical protein
VCRIPGDTDRAASGVGFSQPRRPTALAFQGSPVDGPDVSLLAEYERSSEYLFTTITAACSPGAPLTDQITSALAAALDLFAKEPALADLLMIEGREGEGALSELHRKRVEAYADLLRRARIGQSGDPSSPSSRSIERPIVSAITSLISSWTSAGDAKRLSELLPGLCAFTLAALGVDQIKSAAEV